MILNHILQANSPIVHFESAPCGIAQICAGTNEMNRALLDPKIKVADNALVSYAAFSKALEHSIKKYNKKDALKGMAEVSNAMNNLGFNLYQKGDFARAYEHFDGVLQVNKMLKQNDMKPILKDQQSVNDQMYIAGVAAMSAGINDGTKRYFSILKDQNFDKPVIYEGLYRAYSEEDPDKAVGFLAEGREKFPDNTNLLFQEINHYLNAGEVESLIDKLKIAVTKEPDNASIWTTLGNVYDQQYQKALEGDDEAKINELFDEAFNSYGKALELAPDDFSALYSLGALYYNKAAAVSKEVNVLAEDYSKEGTQKYEAAKAKMTDLFNQALPYFQKAEAQNGTDKNTLIALKEIYARQNDFEKTNAYKAKIEALGE